MIWITTSGTAMKRRRPSAMIGAKTAASPMRTRVGMALLDHVSSRSPRDRPLWHAAPPPGHTLRATSVDSGDFGGLTSFRACGSMARPTRARGSAHEGLVHGSARVRRRPRDVRVRQSVLDAALGRRGGPRRGRHRGRPAVGTRVVPPARRPAPGLGGRAVRRRAPQRGRHGGGVPASARAARHRVGQRLAGGVRLGARREAVRCRRDLQVGHGLPRLHLHGRGPAGWRDLPPLGEPRHGALRRAAVDGRHGLLGERPPRRAGPGARRRGGPHPLRRSPRGELAAHRRERDGAGRAALLLRLGHGGGVVPLHRADRQQDARGRPGRPRTRGRSSPGS